MWWLLVVALAPNNLPLSLGPYPNAEICRRAAHVIEPRNRAYWTDEERANEQRQLTAYVRELHARHATLGLITMADGKELFVLDATAPYRFVQRADLLDAPYQILAHCTKAP